MSIINWLRARLRRNKVSIAHVPVASHNEGDNPYSGPLPAQPRLSPINYGTVDLNKVIDGKTIREWLTMFFIKESAGLARRALFELGLPIVPLLRQRLKAPGLTDWGVAMQNSADLIAYSVKEEAGPVTLELLSSPLEGEYILGCEIICLGKQYWRATDDSIKQNAAALVARKLLTYDQLYFRNLCTLKYLGTHAKECGPLVLYCLKRELKSRDSHCIAGETLSKIGPPPDAVPYLVEAIIRAQPMLPDYARSSNGGSDFIEACFEGLASLGAKAAPAADLFEKGLDCTAPGVRWSAIDGFGAIGNVSSKVKKKLEGIAKGGREYDPQHAVRALAKIDRVSVDEVTTRLNLNFRLSSVEL